MATSFDSLDNIYTMMSPQDLSGGFILNIGAPITQVQPAVALLTDILETDGKGVLSVQDIKQRFEDVATSTDPNSVTKDDINRYFDFYSTKGFLSFASDDVKKFDGLDSDGQQKVKHVGGISEIIGPKFAQLLDPTFDISFLSSRSPFFHPAKRNARRVEIFLNYMPPVVASSISPYLDIEFQSTRDPSDRVQSTGQLRFLLGAVNKDSLSVPDKAMLEARQDVRVGSGDAQKEFDFFGMEAFTMPQTLVNPSPNRSIGTNGLRYTEVLDPFRPLASIESFTVSIVPTVGMYTYKRATMVMKIHDRSRLVEFSELLQPQTYSDVTLWATYGWRAPDNANNPYFDYINSNMMCREAYGIINSNYAFDNSGGVTLTLDLFTKGVAEMRTLKLSDTLGDARFVMNQVQQLGEAIRAYRKSLRLDPPEGSTKEIRIFQLLDAAQSGEFPNMNVSEVQKTIQTLSLNYKRNKRPVPDDVQKLITAMSTLYKPTGSQSAQKFSLKERIQSLSTKNIADKFNELLLGADPFLPTDSKTDSKRDLDKSPLVREIAKYKPSPKASVGKLNKKVVSFGKLFSVFAAQAIVSAQVVDELQVFFYSLNEQCGPVSAHSIAEFPIDLQMFIDQYRAHVVSRGGELITLEEFLALVINAQVLDDRSIGYGLRSFYEPYDPNNHDAQVNKNKEQEFESALAARTQKYGAFKKPVIEMYIETTHQKPTSNGNSDILKLLSYSVKDAQTETEKDLKAKQLKRIMRVHVYDKQANTEIAASQLLRSSDGRGFVQLPSTEYAKKLMGGTSLQNSTDAVKAFGINLQKAIDDKTSGVTIAQASDAVSVKNLVSKLVPTITVGANGSRVSRAELGSKNEPLLSTVNMLRSNTTRNSAAPNGSGEGGVPLRVIPGEMSMPMAGCPLLAPAQKFFIDVQTGTTIDNLYILTTLTHTLSPGKFETVAQFAFADAYGTFTGTPSIAEFVASINPDIPTVTK